jgi:hypothetical protein
MNWADIKEPWIDVNVQPPPKDGTEILVVHDDNYNNDNDDHRGIAIVAWLNDYVGFKRNGEDYGWCEPNSWQDEQGGYQRYNNVTHWMPKPPLPQKKEE